MRKAKKQSRTKSATKKKSNSGRRGFAAMSKEKVRQIASMGGRASHEKPMSAQQKNK